MRRIRARPCVPGFGPALTTPDDHVSSQRSTIGYSMRWYRRQIRQGALLALFALAINLVLSFGHVHAIGGGHSDDGQLALSATASSGNGAPSQGDDRGHPDDLC